MGKWPDRLRAFLAELPRRRVVQTAIAYSVGSWVVIEIASVILPAFEAPAWALRTVIAACIVGFPAVLILSWIFDVTPSGLVRTDDLETDDGATGHKPDAQSGGDDPTLETTESTGVFAERRQITVLRFALHCSTDGEHKPDAEDLREVFPAVHDICKATVEQFNGYPAWANQDEGEAYFGFPVAFDHEARSAVQCAIEMQKALTDYRSESIRVGVSTAIHTGLVITEPGQDAVHERPITSEFSRLVARLLDLCSPGEILVSAPTRTLIFDFYETSEHDPLVLAGTTTATFRVSDNKDPLVYRSAGARAAEQLLGREPESALLRERWERASDGEGQAVAVIGDPGIGKSALAGSLIEFCAAQTDAIVAECACTPFNQNVALYPIVHLFRQSVIGISAPMKPDEQLDAIERFFEERDFRLAGNVPLFARLLSVPFESRYPALELPPERLKDDTIELLIELLLKRATDHPVLLVLEDLHWADATTLDLIERIINHGDRARLLLMLTYRPQLEPPWTSNADVAVLTLGTLSRSQAVELVTHAAGDMALPEPVRNKIVAHSDGVPLFLEELTKAVIESTLSVADAGDVDIPLTLHDTLMARLDRLGSAKSIAQMAAVFGREFSFEWLSALMDPLTDAFPDELEKLVESGLTYRRGRGPESRFIFKHILIQEAAYNSLLKRDREDIHSRIARLFVETFPDYGASHPQVVAVHYAGAGENALAIPQYLKAGQFALAHSAYPEAVNQLQSGMDLLPGVADGAARDGLELGLQASLGRAMTATRGYAAHEVEKRWIRAAELAARLDQPEVQVGVTMGLWQAQISQCRLNEASEQTTLLLALAEQTGDATALYPTRTAAGITHFHLGDLERAEQYFDKVTDAYGIDEHRELALKYGQDPSITCLSWHAVSSWIRGFPDLAREQIDASLARARQLDHPFTLAYALRRSIPVLRYAGDRATLDATVAELERIAAENSFAEIGGQVAFWRIILTADTQTGPGPLLQAAHIIDNYRAAGATLNLCYSLGVLAGKHLMLRDFEAARELIEDALSSAQQTGERWCISDLHRLHGDVLARRDPECSAGSTEAYQAALDAAIAQGARFFELRARLALARSLQRAGGTEDAREMLAPARGLIDGEGLPDLSTLAGLQQELHV